jgi:hypothetical protein
MIWGVPAYGPNWRFKIVKLPRLFWRRAGWRNFKEIRVAPWNRTRRPKRRADI